MVLERQHGESWVSAAVRFASLDRIPQAKVKALFTNIVDDGYTEERAAWLTLVELGVL